MTEAPDDREVIPAGEQEFFFEHLFPIARFLIQRGHLPIEDRRDYGFGGTGGGVVCALTHGLTDEDWAAVNERFVLPDNICFIYRVIRDSANHNDIQGVDFITHHGVATPIAEWEAEEDWSDLPADVASAADHIRGRGPG